jgi:hypothetical protein
VATALSQLSKENTCYFCGSVEAEKYPGCNLSLCQNHKYMHNHDIRKMNVEYVGPSIWEGKPVATIIPISDVITN